jgi:1-acyl-sn-glycerol-3-phosphate acyltransferase
MAGWRIEGTLPPLAKFVLIVAPHTSNWDFIVGVLAMFALGLRASWLGKHTIFRFPLAPVLRWLGGEPIDRSVEHGTVAAEIKRFGEQPSWVLALSPEGTRRPVSHWKTGFHRIALGAGVPIVPVWFDYRSRCVGLGPPFQPTADESADVVTLRRFFRKDMARHPAQYIEKEGGPPDPAHPVSG